MEKRREDQPRDKQAEQKNGDASIVREGSSILDPAQFRLSQDFEKQIGVKKALLSVPVRKPDRQWFVRSHPDNEYSLPTAVVELREERETYLVDPSLWPELPGELIPKVLVTAINRQGVVFLWPIRLPGEDGRLDEWNRTGLEAAEMAKTRWLRVAANMSLGAYEVFEATGDLPDPEWPSIPMSEILGVAFRDRIIQDPDHAVIRRFRGEI